MTPFALIAAAGSLAVAPAPADAAQFAPAFDIAASETSAPALYYGDPPPHARAYGRYRDRDRYEDRRYRDRDYRDRDYRDDRIYDRRGRYLEPRRIRERDRVWRGRDGNYYCERGNGTTGLVVGAGVGALLGRTIDTRGDRTVGTLLGGALGAVLGREIDRGGARCR